MWKKMSTPLILVVMLCLSLLAGCGSPYKSSTLLPRDLFQAKSRNAVNSSSLSWQAQQTLRLMFLERDYHSDPSAVIAQLVDSVQKEPTPELRMTLAELSILHAQKRRPSEPQKVAIYYMIAAQQAYEYLLSDARTLYSSPLTPSFRFMADIYNLALAELIMLRAGRPDRWDPQEVDFHGVRYQYQVVRQGPGAWDPTWFDYLYNAYEIRVSGFANEYITRGLGAPLVGIVEKPRQNPHFGRFFPLNHACYPVTAVLLFDPVTGTDPPTRDIRLVFYDALQKESIQIQNHTIPLEADFTTPLGLQLRKTNPFRVGIGHLLKSDVELKNAGIYLLEPYNPDKIPVVMVHGLMSSPATWAGMFNDLRGDPVLRKRYQFWFFMYPTGLPIGYSTHLLRQQLNAVRAYLDPNAENPNFNRMVLIGHSMGGLLSRGMVQSPGSAFWDMYFDKPIEQVDLEPDKKELLRELMFFEPLPYVKRVIFIATPHRGSPMADAWYTKILSGMVGLPSFVSDTFSDLAGSSAVKQTAISNVTKKSPTSLTLLSPSSNYIKMTNLVPLRSDIPCHSIIGTRIRTAKGEGTSDGIVPYASSHLDVAQSEVLVPSNHGAHEHPLAIAEVKRILFEHLKAEQ